MKKLKYIALILLVSKVAAQVETNVNGLGRAILTNNKLSGQLLEGDTLSPKKGLSGYNLFDLGFEMKKGREFEANMILRVRQPWGEFWGEETKFEFRQLRIAGDLKQLSYELGDIDVVLSPYTLYNNEEIFREYEADIFSDRRDIVNYENFVKNNVWRLQGAKAGFGIYPTKVIEEAVVNVFGVRTTISDDINIPDRVMVGGQLDMKVNSKLGVKGYMVNWLDVALDDFATNYKNTVATLGAEYEIIEKDSMKVSLEFESGMSAVNYYRNSDDTTFEANDFFVDAGVKVERKNIEARLGYKNVGLQFMSPGAQTRRIDVTQTPALFSAVNNGTGSRSLSMFDRFTQEGVYNRALSPVLQAYVPYYNNVNPYGKATPNRAGLELDLAKKGEVLTVSGQVQKLSELVGEGSVSLRKFLAVRGGARFDLGKYLDVKRVMGLSLGTKLQNTTRDDGIDMSSLSIEGGFTVGLTSKMELLGGVKYLNASGNELVANRDDLNYITGYDAYDVDLGEFVSAIGVRLQLNSSTNFIVNYNAYTLTDNAQDGNSYRLGQLFMNFNLMF